MIDSPPLPFSRESSYGKSSYVSTKIIVLLEQRYERVKLDARAAKTAKNAALVQARTYGPLLASFAAHQTSLPTARPVSHPPGILSSVMPSSS